MTKKSKILFFVLGLLLGLVIGILSVNIYDKVTEEKIEEKEINNNSKDNNEEENIDKDNAENEENVDGNDEKNIDAYFSNLNIKYNDDELNQLINTSSYKEAVSDNFIGAMFATNISDEYKLYVTLNRAINIATKTESEYTEAIYNNDIKLNKETIEKLGKQIFQDFKIPEKISKDSRVYGVTSFTCDGNICTFDFSTFGLQGPTPNGYVTEKIVKKDNKVTVTPIYAEYEYEAIEPDKESPVNITIKESINGKVIKELKNHKINIFNSEDIHNSLKQYNPNRTTYTYHFNDNNVLIKVDKK